MMNRVEYDVFAYLYDNQHVKQRTIAQDLHISLGRVNTAVKTLIKHGYIKYDYSLSEHAKQLRCNSRPQKAVLLAAGLGFRMIPLNKNTNKVLLKVHGVSLIERLIQQLQEAGISDISIVVGFRKEEFEFLMDIYHVKLCINMEYASSNTLVSLSKSKSDFKDCYIVPCDLYFYENPFHSCEFYSWYMMSSACLSQTRTIKNKDKISALWYQEHEADMVGLAYVHRDQAEKFQAMIQERACSKKYQQVFWEDILWHDKEQLFYPVFIKAEQYVECNCCEDLIHLDAQSTSLHSEVFDIITEVFHVARQEIKNIVSTKAGMTNNSFMFEIHNEKYIMRIPGDGTQHLINRQQEGEVYDVIGPYHISDEILYFHKDNGYKITRFIPNSTCCNPKRREDVIHAMRYLKQFHNLNLQVGHTFDIFEKIAYYESLWNGQPSIYPDYEEVKQQVLSLKSYLDKLPIQYRLTHIDAVPDNFLFHEEEQKLCIHLIDWEYAAMQDPHVDIAMFAIYSLYDSNEIDDLIDIYFEGYCTEDVRMKIYCYIACCGLLWSNWCEYKRQLGIEFGEYSLYQYHYAKRYYQIVSKERRDFTCHIK